MYRIIVILLLLAACICRGAAQQVECAFPSLPDERLSICYYSGSHTDTIWLTLDKQGAGLARLPDGYKGFIQVVIPGKSAFECIGGEPLLRIESPSARPDRDNVRFPASPENDFLYRLFDEKSLYMNRASWIAFGMQLYEPSSELYKRLEQEIAGNDRQLAAITQEIKAGKLYAARLLQLMDHLNELDEALNRPGNPSPDEIKAHLHTLDWEALYTSGEFWTLIHQYYAELFDKLPLSPKERQSHYVEAISPLFASLKEPLRSAFLETSYELCESAGWDDAKDLILSYISQNGLRIDARNENLRRLLSAGKIKVGNPAPAIKGLAEEAGLTLLIFYESGCDNCILQLEEMKEHYAQLSHAGIRVVSVSADMDEGVFSYHSRSFPWPDKLCDYQGYMGENFINYAILATPTLFVIGKGIIIGRYAKLSDTGLF
jgi:hypothetical protein